MPFDHFETKSLEEQLHESQMMLKSLFNNSQSVMLLIDTTTGCIVDANESAYSFYGYTKNEILSKNISDINTLDKDEILQRMKQVLSGKKGDYSFQHRLANGEIREVEVQGLAVQDKPLIFAIVHDFTKRKKSEEEIKEAYLELSQIFNSAADGMRVIDKNFNILRINDKLLEALELKKEDAVGHKCFDILPGAYCHTPDCPIQRIMGGDSFVEYEVEKELKKGIKTPYIMKATPFHEFHGELLGIVQDFKDITERKKLKKKSNSWPIMIL
ncbi:PAS domain-containing protein [Tepidibacillus marianensis]|uniref:PAS domain-containing protein n=1 Tax=Tepidibacillus marianensis TaxID=3131995 RepID=UPI0030D24BBC